MRIVTIILPMIFAVSFSFAQEKNEEEDNRKILSRHFSIGIPQLLFSTLNIGMEKDFLKKGNAIALNGEITIWAEQENDHKVLGFGGEIFYKLKIFRKTIFTKTKYFHQFLYMAPYFRCDYFQEQEEEKGSTSFASPVSISYNYFKSGTSIAYSGGCILGIRWTIAKKVDIELFAGGGIKYPETTGHTNFGRFNNGILSPAHKGVFAKGGFRAGVSF